MHQVLSIKEVVKRYRKTKSPIYADIQAGLFPAPFKLGTRAAGWLDAELEALIAARAAGASDEQIRQLVERLHAQRLSGMPALA